MIHHSDKKHVSPNTVTTDIPHISLDRYLELQAENKLLRQEIARLSQHNEVLHNCWVCEKQRYLDAAGVIRELESHLNPPEQVRSQKSEVINEDDPTSDFCLLTSDLEQGEAA